MSTTPTSAEIVRQAFDEWKNGDGHVARLFASEMRWEIVGHSRAAATYTTAQELEDAVLTPFARRFRADQPFRPVEIRAVYADGDSVIVIWDGAGTTITGTTYSNTYAWILRLRDGLVVEATAFFDSISFDELWKIDPGAAR